MRADPVDQIVRRWSGALRDARTWHPPVRRTLFVVPHPDDESLSMGGLIQRQVSAGVQLVILAVTDGDAAYDAAGNADLARNRRVEQDEALARLAGNAPQVHRLGLPDSSVADHEDTIAGAIDALLDNESLLVAPWIHDHHPDHEATGRAARRAARAHDVPLVSSLFWAWHHGSSASCDGRRLLALTLSPHEHRGKRDAIRCHRSQVEPTQVERWGGTLPILEDTTLAITEWNEEYYVEDTE